MNKNEPICKECGHTSYHHTTKLCTFRTVLHLSGNGLAGGGYVECDCAGWERDEGWPPPIIRSNAALI